MDSYDQIDLIKQKFKKGHFCKKKESKTINQTETFFTDLFLMDFLDKSKNMLHMDHTVNIHLYIQLRKN